MANPPAFPRFPSGTPSGWYVVATTRELRPGNVVARRYFGHELVIYRTQSGLARVCDAHCPHMGAHLGHGGRVEGELLRCPFHGFRYDTDGRCVATGYGTEPPPSIRLHRWPVREQNGIILVWYHPGGAEPSWEIPGIDMQGWSSVTTHRYRVRSHPQEMTEGSVDLSHFSEVHNFASVGITEPARTDGPLLKIAYTAERKMIGISRLLLRMEYRLFVWGLGYQFVEVELPRLGVRFRSFVSPVPVDEQCVDMHVGMSTNRARLGPLADPINRLLFVGFRLDAHRDLPIAENKVYVDPPKLAKGDGPIGLYRKWARQFYTE